jgi:Ni,Fe-hydrogenase I large subunit
VLGFIAESLPASMQLIVCVTKDSDTQLDKRITFDKKYSMLLAEFYEEVESDVGPLYRQMNAALLKTPLNETNGHDSLHDADE